MLFYNKVYRFIFFLHFESHKVDPGVLKGTHAYA